MSSKIFKAIWIVAIAVFLASLLLIMGTLYSYFSSLQRDRLRMETELAAQGVALSGASYFDQLKTDDYRITWVGPDGSVLFDNEADAAAMQNHLEREEIKQAMEEGFGEATRRSFTLADQQYYAAKRLPDGSVLRLSIAQMSVWSLLLGFAQPICFIVLAALILSYVLASRIAKKIVKPINEIDLDHPGRYCGEEDYQEIEPLLRHISAQQTQLKLDREEIEKTALIRQEFSANVSHELKTPLHAISGYAELLENGLVKEEDIKPFAAKIRHESLRMTRLVEDIIDLTKLDNGGTEMKWEDCDFFRITENAVDSLAAAAAAMNVTVSISGEKASVTAIPQLLYSIAYNLCDNAIKYNHNGGRVSVSVTQNERSTVLAVKDTGIGIPKEEQKRVFERFYRVDKSRSREVGGTGLGLSIVKHGVMIHGGRITLNSAVGKGAEFIVTIPNKPKQ
ncbi:MAG: PAS domain-containing sensor histidine kinase [Firmicutes bacterium]|nr:PAS domain-containing sensor histidine kinase [Bacillota bacterium]